MFHKDVGLLLCHHAEFVLLFCALVLLYQWVGIDEPDEGWEECIQQEHVGLVLYESTDLDDVAEDEDVSDVRDNGGVEEECDGEFGGEFYGELALCGDTLQIH